MNEIHPTDPRILEKRRARLASFLSWGFLGAISLIGLAIPLAFGSAFQPIADDYCLAAAVKGSGFLGSIGEQYMNWSGALAADTLASLFPSISILISPSLGYLMPTVFTFTIGYLAFYAFFVWSASFRVVINKRFGFAAAVVAFVVFALSQFGITPSGGNIQFAFGYSLFGWLAASISQFIPAIILLLSCAVWVAYQKHGRRLHLVAVFIMAGLLGQMNFVAPLTFVLLISFLTVIAPATYARRKSSLLLMALLAVSMAANFFSPGTMHRRTVISDANKSVFVSAIDFFHMIIGSISAAPIMLAVLLGLIFTLTSKVVDNNQLLRAFAFSIVFLSASFIATSLTDILGASELWHVALIQLAIYIFSVLLGAVSGNVLRSTLEIDTPAFVSTFLVSFLLIAIGTDSYFVFQEISARSSVQQKGSNSPVHFINDREIPWIKQCSDVLST